MFELVNNASALMPAGSGQNRIGDPEDDRPGAGCGKEPKLNRAITARSSSSAWFVAANRTT